MPLQLKLKPGGVNQYFDPVLGETIEGHSSTCFHCQKITDFPSLKRMFDHVEVCRSCMKLVCTTPECLARGCRPYEKEAERQEQEAIIRANVHKQAWACY